MINQKVNEDAQLARLKYLMGYGITESKAPAFSSIEYSKVGSDGNLYGIVREGTNFYIKVAKDAKGSVITENFDYIGGFRNRKDNMFESFASAQKYLSEKIANLREELGEKQNNVITENMKYDPANAIVAECTDKMKDEIARQRQIMENAMIIEQDGSCCGKCKNEFKPVKGKKADENSESPKADAKKSDDSVKDYHGNSIKSGVGAPFTEKLEEATETPLVSRENPDYIDQSHGTEIGKCSGFGKKVDNKTEGAVAEDEGGEAVATDTPDNVNEGASMHDADNQNTPKPGTGEKGEDSPFDEDVTITEAVDGLEYTLDDDEDDFDGSEFEDEEGEDEEPIDGEEVAEPIEGEEEPVGDDAEPIEEPIEEPAGDEMSARMDAIEQKMDSILDALQSLKYDDEEPLYDDEEGEDGDEYEIGMDDENEGDEDYEEEPEDDEDETEVVESRSYRKMRMNEDRLNYFGKHPAYQKKVMTLPTNNNFKRQGQYDMNDSSVDGEAPYGIKKGDTAPFKKSVEKIENEITEAVMKILKKKLN